MALSLRYVSDDNIKNVQKHVFHAGEYTPLDLAMNPFWARCQTFLPRWISPNAVTLFGGLCLVLMPINVFCAGTASVATHLLNSFLVFLYQTADAVDGKHARATQQSTPLGALVDHGVDGLSLMLIPGTIWSALDPSCTSLLVPCALNLYATVWFVSQWADYESSILETAGVTEAEFGIVFALAAPAIFGRGVYDTAVTATMNVKCLIAYIFVAAMVLKLLVLVYQVMSRTRKPKALGSLFPIVLHNVASYIFFTSASARAEPMLYFSIIMANVSTISVKMVLSVITRTPWPALHLETVPFMCVSILSLKADIPRWVCLALLAWQVFCVCHLAYDTISRICTCLGIPFMAEVPLNFSCKAPAPNSATTKPNDAPKTDAVTKTEVTNARKRASTPEGRRVTQE